MENIDEKNFKRDAKSLGNSERKWRPVFKHKVTVLKWQS